MTVEPTKAEYADQWTPVVVSLPKHGNTDEECEDAVVVVGHRVAISDGATVGSGQRQWAQILAHGAIETALPFEDTGLFDEWLAQCRSRWADRRSPAVSAHVAAATPAWMRKHPAPDSAAATLLWAEIEAVGDQSVLSVAAVGDSCVVIQGPGGFRSFPLQSAEQFGTTPPLLGSRDHGSRPPVLVAQFSLSPDDTVWIATDAVAKFLIQGIQHRKEVANLWTADAIARRLADLREQDLIEDDDLTLVVVRPGNPQRWPLEEPTGGMRPEPAEQTRPFEPLGSYAPGYPPETILHGSRSAEGLPRPAMPLDARRPVVPIGADPRRAYEPQARSREEPYLGRHRPHEGAAANRRWEPAPGRPSSDAAWGDDVVPRPLTVAQVIAISVLTNIMFLLGSSWLRSSPGEDGNGVAKPPTLDATELRPAPTRAAKPADSPPPTRITPVQPAPARESQPTVTWGTLPDLLSSWWTRVGSDSPEGDPSWHYVCCPLRGACTVGDDGTVDVTAETLVLHAPEGKGTDRARRGEYRANGPYATLPGGLHPYECQTAWYAIDPDGPDVHE